MSRSARNLALLAALLIGGCGGGNGDPPSTPPTETGGGGDFSAQSNEFCHTIPILGLTTVGVTTANETASFDDDFATGSNIQPGGQLTIRGTSVKQAGGSVAGVYLGSPNVDGMTVVITTLLNGRPQQANPFPVSRQGPVDNCSGNATCDWTDHGTFIGMPTGPDYDAIEVTISNSGTSDLYVNELCVK